MFSNTNKISLLIFQPLDEYNKRILKYISKKDLDFESLRLELNMVTKFDFHFFFYRVEISL